MWIRITTISTQIKTVKWKIKEIQSTEKTRRWRNDDEKKCDSLIKHYVVKSKKFIGKKKSIKKSFTNSNGICRIELYLMKSKYELG